MNATMNGKTEKGMGRRPWRFGVCGEEWVAVLFLLVAVIGVLAERAAYLEGAAGII